MILKYLPNLPPVPLELYQDALRIATTKEDELPKFAGGSYGPLRLYPIDGELYNWIVSNIPITFGKCIHLHVINDNVEMHKDFQDERYKLNFIFKTGGDCVETRFHDDNGAIIEKNIIEPGTWHQFDGTVNHSVHGIESGKLRAAITLGTNTLLC